MREDCPRLPSSYVDRFYVDAAVFSGDALAFLVKTMGEDRVMLGSDYPFPLGEQQVGSLIRSHESLPGTTREKLLHANATRFFGLEPHAPPRRAHGHAPERLRPALTPATGVMGAGGACHEGARMTSARLERWITRKFRLRHVRADRRALRLPQHPQGLAAACNLSQPTVTKALQDVETTLGLPLFERTNRGLEPTAYGEIFARHAKIVLAQLRHAAEELEGLRVGYSGKVTVGTLLAASASILPDAIALLKKERPGVAISVVVGTYDILMPSLLVGDLDMVLGRLPEEGRSRALVYEEFYAEPVCLVTRRGHPLTRKRRLDAARAWRTRRGCCRCRRRPCAARSSAPSSRRARRCRRT